MLGSGAFGTVCRSIDHKTARMVAIKLTPRNGKFAHTSKTEAELLKALKHSRHPSRTIINMYESFCSGDYHCIVFELLGYDLYKVIKLNQHMSLHGGFVRGVARQLIQALMKLESYDIIHCDIKPENILLVHEPLDVKKLSSTELSAASEQGFLYTVGQYR